MLRAHVGGLDRERLVELVVEQAGRDWRLRERLTAEAAAQRGAAVDVAAWRHRLEAVFACGEFVPYAEAQGWAGDVTDVLDALAELLEVGQGEAVVACR